MLAHLNEDEQLAIKTFAAWYREDDRKEPWTREAVLKYFDWSESRFHVVMHRLESLDLITDQSTSGIEFLTFAIQPAMSRAAEELQAAEKSADAAQPTDLVDVILYTARRHPVLSWAVIVALIAAVLLTIVNGTFELGRNILSLLRTSPPGE